MEHAEVKTLIDLLARFQRAMRTKGSPYYERDRHLRGEINDARGLVEVMYDDAHPAEGGASPTSAS